MTGTYYPETHTLYWTTGNPSPDYDGTVREGEFPYPCHNVNPRFPARW